MRRAAVEPVAGQGPSERPPVGPSLDEPGVGRGDLGDGAPEGAFGQPPVVLHFGQFGHPTRVANPDPAFAVLTGPGPISIG